jgi:tryptophanyl-tRNA synthetase
MCSTAGWGCIDCKRVLLESVKRELTPIHERASDLRARPERVREVLARGAERCRALARETLGYVKERMGLV